MAYNLRYHMQQRPMLWISDTVARSASRQLIDAMHADCMSPIIWKGGLVRGRLKCHSHIYGNSSVKKGSGQQSRLLRLVVFCSMTADRFPFGQCKQHHEREGCDVYPCATTSVLCTSCLAQISLHGSSVTHKCSMLLQH